MACSDSKLIIKSSVLNVTLSLHKILSRLLEKQVLTFSLLDITLTDGHGYILQP